MYKLILFVILIFNISLNAQVWKDDPLAREFREKIIYDMFIEQDVCGVLCNDIFYLKKKDSISSYNLYTNFKNNEGIFSNLVNGKNSIWIYGENNSNKILRISENCLKEYNLDIKDYLEYRIPFASIYDSSFVFACSYFTEDNKFLEQVLLDTTIIGRKTKFYEIKKDSIIPYKYLNIENQILCDFFIIEKTIVCLINDDGILKTLFIKNNSIDTVILDYNTKTVLCKHYVADKYIYLLDNNKNLYIFDNFNLTKKIKLPITNSIQNNFIIVKNNIFLPSSDGLIIIDLDDLDFSVLKPNNFDKNCFRGFSKIVMHNFNLFNTFYLLYGGIIRHPCNSKLWGLAYLVYD